MKDKHEDLYNKVKEYISLGFLSYGDLVDAQRNELIYLIPDKNADDWMLSKSIEDKFNTYIHERTFSSASILAYTMQLEALAYYEKYINCVFTNSLKDIAWARNIENGLIPMKDNENGETYWEKR